MYLTRAADGLRRLQGDRSGLAAVEFALALPLLLVAGLYGTETANLALTHMKVSQVAMHVADNAARLGDTSTITNRALFEADVSDLLNGSKIQGGTKLNFYEYGRTIVSSVEVYDPDISCAGKKCKGGFQTPGVQFIHWQRCMGRKNVTSAYGGEYDSVPNGIGPSGQEVSADAGSALIFVEVAYDYQPLVSSRFFGPTTIRAVGSFTQRDNVDLSGLKKMRRRTGETAALCSRFRNGI